MDFNKIAQKWQSKWEKKKIFIVKEDNKRRKFYCIEMFPYPSSEGLHMGHAFNYTIGDIYARFKRMQGFNVLYPMGYDSLGLPAENAAIKEGIHPKKYTEKAIANFIKQQKALGLSYDWNRMFDTHDPKYYKWDQWTFLKMFEKGLAYRKKAAVNFCPKCNTVLANEQVHDGKCWRHKDTDVEIKQLEQWFFKITNYADELYEDINKLSNWQEDVKAMQRNWIGKSYGVDINFKINGKNWPIFTTRPDTIYGVTFMVVSAQHPRLMELVTDKQKKDVENFLKKIKSTSEKEVLEKEGVFTGSYAINPLTNEKVPVYVGNFVVAEYGSGMVMAVPAHDQRDFEFAKKYEIPIKVVIQPENSNCIVIHGSPSRDKRGEPGYKPVSEKHWIPWMKKKMEENRIKTFTPQMPTPWKPVYEEWKKEFEKLEINENTILIGHSAGGAFLVRWLGEKQRRINKLILVAPGKTLDSDNVRLKELYNFEINKNIRNLVDIIIIFISNDTSRHISDAKIYAKEVGGGLIELRNKGHFVTDQMGTEEFPELLEISLRIDKAYAEEGILVNSGKFSGLNSSEAIEKISDYIEKSKIGKRVVNYKLRDWLISRQRYWGTPIPIAYCGKCGIVPVPEKDLPVKLPEKVKFGIGNPLETNEKFVNVKCPKCKGKARRETDTMDTFVNSSWYFLRYCDPKNNKEIFDKKKVKYWMPIDTYIGGKEHACMHLIYFRFYTKFLRDIGLLNFDEPTLNLFNQGMVHGSDGAVMSKSRGNVVDPLITIKKFGADTLRFYLVSSASPDKDFIWSDTAIKGSYKFVNKVINYFENVKIGKSSKKTESKVNKAIKEVTEDIEKLQYNLAVIKLRKLFESLENEISKKDLENILKLLHPFCPFVTEELWSKLKNKGFISLEKWPKADESKIDKKFEQEELLIENLANDINNIEKIMKTKGKRVSKAFIYTLPNEKNIYLENIGIIKKKTNLDITVFAVNDKNKHDPQNKASKSKPGKPAIFIE